MVPEGEVTDMDHMGDRVRIRRCFRKLQGFIELSTGLIACKRPPMFVNTPGDHTRVQRWM